MPQRLRPSKQAPELTFKEKWKYWLNLWRISEIRNTYKKEHKRVYGNANYLINKGRDKLNR